jgi:cell division protease FtsH
MVTVYGLNDKVGNLTYHDSSGQGEYNFTKPYSEKTSELIDKEISNLIEEQYQRAVKLLEENKDKLTELAEILLEKEVIFKDNLEEIFGKRPYKSRDEIMSGNSQEKKVPAQEETVTERTIPGDTTPSETQDAPTSEGK